MLTVVLCAAMISCAESHEETVALYKAWKKANPEHKEMDFEDWSVLRHHDMLPGVDYATMYAKKAKRAAESAEALSAVNVGISSGNTSRSK